MRLAGSPAWAAMRGPDVVTVQLDPGLVDPWVDVQEAVLLVADRDQVVRRVGEGLELQQLLPGIGLRLQQHGVVQREGAPVGEVRDETRLLLAEVTTVPSSRDLDQAHQVAAGTQRGLHAHLEPEAFRQRCEQPAGRSVRTPVLERQPPGSVEVFSRGALRGEPPGLPVEPERSGVGAGLVAVDPQGSRCEPPAGRTQPDDAHVRHRLGHRPDRRPQQGVRVGDLAAQRRRQRGQQVRPLPGLLRLALHPALLGDVGGDAERAGDVTGGVADRFEVDAQATAAEVPLHVERLSCEHTVQVGLGLGVVLVEDEQVLADQLAGRHPEGSKAPADRERAPAAAVDAEDHLGADPRTLVGCLRHVPPPPVRAGCTRGSRVPVPAPERPDG